MSLSHFDSSGKARMVDVTDKAITRRTAIARGEVRMQPETLRKIQSHAVIKGDVLTVAKVAAIMAAKKTAALIPMCHPLPLTHVDVDFRLHEPAQRVEITATAVAEGKTGVEMEALTAVAVAALTIYDMCKAVDKTMVIGNILLLEKQGGRSGTFRREKTD